MWGAWGRTHWHTGPPIADAADTGALLLPEPAVHALHAAPHCRDSRQGWLSPQPLGPRLPLMGRGGWAETSHGQDTLLGDGTHQGFQLLPHMASLV